MALFRKLFYRKPPDGLLEICERVYVFDRCFTTDALEDQDYRGYVGGIVTQLREIYPDASILAFNFREGDTQSEIGNALSEYDMTIMEYPKHYEGCPLLPMEVIHHFLRSSESWLSLGLQNVLLMHCERGGWPVLAFMLAALLIYRKHYSGEQKTLDMVYKQAPRELLHLLSPLNPIPSQLRYLQYVSRRNVATQWPPLDRALTLDCIMIRMIPNFDGEGGCRPIFRIYGQDPCLVSDRTPKVLFSTPKKSRVVRHYKQAECEIVKVDINCHIQGDVVLECISLHDDMKREVMMFRVMFNTAFIRSNILMLNRDEIDVLWDAKDLFPRDFRAEVLFSEMDTVASVIPVDSSCFEEKEGLPVEAFAKVQEIFSSVDWLSPKGEAAAEVLQQLAVSNTAIEAFSHAALGIKSITKSPSNLSLECQSNLSPQSSPNADVSRNQAEPQSSPTKIGPIIFSKQTLMPSGDHSPPSSTSPHQLSVAKTLHLSPNQRLDSNENGMVKGVSPVSEAKIAYPNNLPPGPPAQPKKDVNLVPGRSPLSPEPFPITPSLEEKIGLQNSSSSLPLLTPEIPSALSPPLKDDTTIKPAISCPPAESRRNHDKVIEYEHPKVKPPFSTTSSAEDFVGGPIVANPPPRASSPPQIHPSSIVNVEKSTGAGSASPWTTLCSNIGVIQVTECGSPAPHLSFPKTDTILKTALRTPPPTDLDATFTKESSTSICPTPPAPLPPTSHFIEKSECVVGPSSPPSAPYITDSSKADRPASCLHPLPPPLPPLLGPPLSAAATPPPAPLLQEHYVPEAVPPPPLTPPLRDISVARPVPHLPPPPPKFPKAISSGGESTSPDSGNAASSSAPPLGDSLVTGTVPCPPPPPPLPPKEISVGGEPLFHPPPLYYGQGTTSLPTLSPRPSPPPPATPTTRSSPIPSAPPPPLASPSTRSSPCVPLAPPPPPASPSTRSSHSVPLAPPPPPVSPATKSSIPLAPPPPPGSPNIRSSPSIPSAPPPPPASPNIRSSSIPSAPPPPPASPSTKSSIPSAPPPPPDSPNLRSSPSIPSAPPPPPASPNTRSSPSVPSAPPPPPASPTTRSSPSVPSAPPPPFPSTNDPASLSTIGSKGSSLPGSPSPPGPPPPGTKGKSLLSRTIRNNVTKKLKPLHWLKISRAVSGSLWAEAQKSGEASRAPEIDISELESLFSAAVSTPDQDGSGRKTGSRGMGSKPEKVQLIEHRRAYNCEIMLSKVKIPLHEMLSSVLALEDSALDVDQVDNLIKFCPTKEEMEVLKGYKGERDRLGKCEQFFLELMQVPRIEFKLRVYSFKIQFHSQASDLRNNLNIVNSAADQIRVSGKLRRIMQTILNLGNALNQGTARGSAVGFRLDSLLKLTDTRARNNKMTLMHYLCKVLSDQLPELLDFWKDLSSLELASRIQLKYLAEEMQAINKGLEKVMQELSMAENDGPVCDQFCKALKEFLCFSEGEVRSLASLYAGVGRNVDSLILYFGEDPARCQFEQVISTLMNFVRMFKQAHEENCKQIELEKKKAEKEAMEKMKMNAPDTGHLLKSEVKSVK